MKLPISPTLLRFLIAGGVNTGFGLAVYSAVALTPAPTWLVLIITNVAGLMFNFLTSGGFVFRDLSAGRLPRFLLSYAIILPLYWGLIRWLTPIAGGRIGAMLIIIAPMTVLTYLLQSKFVFRTARQSPDVGA